MIGIACYEDTGSYALNLTQPKDLKAAIQKFVNDENRSIFATTQDRAIMKQGPKPVGNYPHTKAVGNLLFLSGVGPRIAGSDSNDSGVPGLELDHNGNFKAFDFAAQVHSVLGNVKAILEANGSQWENLVDITVFLVDMHRDFGTFNRIYAEYFPDPETQPCRTTVEINQLPTPIAIELKCMAVLS